MPLPKIGADQTAALKYVSGMREDWSMGRAASSQITEEQIKQAFRTAVRTVWRDDPVLVREGTHERTVVAHIGWALRPEVASWLGSWDIDVEYNRWHRESMEEFTAKYLRGSDGLEHCVYPDLIVHQRGRNGHAHNLLVVEAKCGRVSTADRERDYGKLRGFLNVFGYRQAVFLEFDGKGGLPRLEWLSAAQPHGPDPSTPASEIVHIPHG